MQIVLVTFIHKANRKTKNVEQQKRIKKTANSFVVKVEKLEPHLTVGYYSIKSLAQKT